MPRVPHDVAGHRPYVRWPDPRLKAVAEPVTVVDDAVREIWDEMVRAMVAMPGIGLAAPQLGIGRRLAVVDASVDVNETVRLANPVIVEASERTRVQREGSPNIPGVYADVTRPAEVKVSYLDEQGRPSAKLFAGAWAQSVQHQIDLLDGLMFVDRLSPLKRQRLVQGYLKAQKKARR